MSEAKRDAFKWIVWARAQHPGAAKPTLLCIATYADVDDGTCYPSVKELASGADIGESTVLRHIASLKAKGLIAVTNRGRDTNVYQLLASTSQISEQTSQIERLTDLTETPNLSKTHPQPLILARAYM